MELKQIRSFLEVARHGSLTRAALALDSSQPTLSRDIRLLESELEVALFQRNGRGVVLTEVGRIFEAAVAAHVAGIDEARTSLLALSGRPRTLRLAWSYPFSRPVGPDILGQFSRAFPDIDLHVRGVSSEEVERLIEHGEVDIGVLNSDRPRNGPQAETFLSMPLCHVSSGARGPQRHGVAADTIPLAEALAGPLYLHGRTQPIRRAVEAAARAAGLRLGMLAEMDEFSLVRQLLTKTGASTITAPSVIGPGDPGERLQVRRIDPEIPLYFVLVYPKSKRGNAAVRRLAKMIHDEAVRALKDGRLVGVSHRQHSRRMAQESS